MLGLIGQMRVSRGGQNGVVAEEFLHLDQIDTGLDQVGGIAVAQTVGRDVFFGSSGKQVGKYVAEIV